MTSLKPLPRVEFTEGDRELMKQAGFGVAPMIDLRWERMPERNGVPEWRAVLHLQTKVNGCTWAAQHTYNQVDGQRHTANGRWPFLIESAIREIALNMGHALPDLTSVPTSW